MPVPVVQCSHIHLDETKLHYEANLIWIYHFTIFRLMLRFVLYFLSHSSLTCMHIQQFAEFFGGNVDTHV